MAELLSTSYASETNKRLDNIDAEIADCVRIPDAGDERPYWNEQSTPRWSDARTPFCGSRSTISQLAGVESSV